MGRRVKDAVIETRSAREKLRTSGELHYRGITRGLALGYRKGKTLGVWVARWRDGDRYVVETIGVADAGAAQELALSSADMRARSIMTRQGSRLRISPRLQGVVQRAVRCGCR